MSHSHAHDHHTHSATYNRSFALAIFLNAGFVVIQTIYALKAGSMSLLADAAHNFGDVFGLSLAWGANWLLTLPARRRYSYGYKRTTIIAALINALILTAGSTLIAWESIDKLIHPTPMQATTVIFVALAGIFINGSTALLFMRGSEHDLNIRGAFIHLAADALISLGVVIAGILTHFTGILWLDPLTGLLIVLVILWSTSGLLRNSISLILDAIPRHIDHQGISSWLATLPGVTDVHDLHIWGLSTREVALTAHLTMPEKKLSDAEFHRINTTLKEKFRIDHATLQVESGSTEFACHRIDHCGKSVR